MGHDPDEATRRRQTAIAITPIPRRSLVAADGKLEEFETTTKHDGTTEHPEWLESSSI